jgi:isochorismate synthase EntC
MLLKECINVFRAFQQISTNTLPLKTSWMLAQNISKLKPVVELFEEQREIHIAVLKTKASTDAKGEPEVSEEDAAAFRDQVEELLNTEQKIRLKKVTLIDDGTLTIEPNVLLAAMDYLIVKEDANISS